MMVQQTNHNPLTKIIKEHCTEQLPQVQIQQPSSSSEEETAPEDLDWSSEVSEPEEPTSPQPIMMNQPTDEPVVTEVQDKTDEVE